MYSKKNWPSSRLGDWFKLSSGSTKPQYMNTNLSDETPYPVFGGNGIIGYSYDVNADGKNIIVGRVGAKCGCIHFYEGPCWITDNALYTKEHKKKYDARFMALLLDFLRIDKFRSKGGQPLITQTPIHNLKVTIPKDISEQKKISVYIHTWVSAIEKTERLIEAKEKVKKSLILKLLFGKVRIGGRRTSGVKEKYWISVPSDWKIVKIGSVSKEVSDRNQNGDDVPVLSCTKYDGLVDSLKYFDKQIFSKDTSTYKVVAHGQFAYATNHIEEGSIGYQHLYPQGLVSPMYTVFETDKQKVNDGYLYKLLKTETYRRIFAINTNASVDRRGSLRWNEFSKLPIPFPSLDEQTEINEVLDTAQKEVDLLKGQLELLKKQKRGLMQKLLIGKWRVRIGGEKSQ